MKKKEVFKCAAFCFTVFFLMVPDVCVGDDGMEILNSYFEIDTGPRHQWYPKLADNNPINNEFMAVWRTSGKLRDDCEPGDMYECTNSFKTINARRISPDGDLLADPIELSPPEVGDKSGPGVVHNIFTNEYMVSFFSALTTGLSEMHIARMNSVGEIQYGPYSLYPSTSDAGHGEIVFNSVRREYLVVYNDNYIFNDYHNQVGFILDESGNPIKGPFPVGNQVGDFYAPSCAYNSTDDNYLCAWEDFRHVDNWIYPGDAYGALLDSNGDMIVEIPILDDYHMPGGDTYPGYESKQDQRVPTPCYNPDKNEFLVAWRDHRITPQDPDDAGIFGRIIAGPDGSFKGPDFVIVDGRRMQTSPEMVYVKERKQYFFVWSDTRNDTEPPGSPLWFSDNVDIYATWLDESGMPIGDEIPIAVEPGVQTHSKVAYNPVMKRFLMAWSEKGLNVHDYEVIPSGTMMGTDVPGDNRGTIYGAPSFCCARVIEKGTGNPVEGAQVVVIGRGLLERERTNVGGWCNLPKDSQRNGTYFMIAWKGGHGMAMRSVRYEGEPLQATIELR
jgi:hypothetical protein